MKIELRDAQGTLKFSFKNGTFEKLLPIDKLQLITKKTNKNFTDGTSCIAFTFTSDYVLNLPFGDLKLWKIKKLNFVM